jgi:hypothetical protein
LPVAKNTEFCSELTPLQASIRLREKQISEECKKDLGVVRKVREAFNVKTAR